jgi:ribonuclease HepT-like protein
MSNEVLFRLMIDLIVALSHWLWPIVLLILLLVYRKPIAALLGRVKKGELFGQEFELEPEVNKFQESVKQAEKEIAQLPPSSDVDVAESKRTEIDVNRILDDSKGSPELALIRLSNLLEPEAKNALGSMGFLPRNKRLSGFWAMQVLGDKGLLPQSAADSLKRFWDLRNRIVHGRAEVDEKEILRVLDIGIDLLKTIRSIPHEVHTVEQVVDVYDNPECTIKRVGSKAVILNSQTADGGLLRRLFHSTKTDHYKRGQRVMWEWELTRSIPEGWYIDSRDQSTKIIGGSLDFVGRTIAEI